MRHSRRLTALLGLALAASAFPASADDKDLLKQSGSAPNLMIVFGNSQTTSQPILGAVSAWDGDADSPASKLGAAKRVIQRFVNDKRGGLNVGLTTFAHDPNAKSITITGKHWLYAPLTADYPSETWQEPAGTIERWGRKGEGPCTSITVPACTGRSAGVIVLPAAAVVVGPFFGIPAATAVVYLDGSSTTAKARILVTLAAGKYGNAYTSAALTDLTISGPPAHAMEVSKVYQERTGSVWTAKAKTPGGDPGAVTVFYIPPASMASDSFYGPGADAGREIGFLSDAGGDFDVNANCSGWEFQKGGTPLPLLKIPRDYGWGASCSKPPQDSYPCVTRLLRPGAKLTRYDQTTGTFATVDPDNPGYTGTGNKYADGCDPTLLGGVDAGLDVTENQAILTNRNGSQAPIKNLLDNIYAYFNDPGIDGFQNGKRSDDPSKSCRATAVILVYDNFNGCQNDSCSFLTNHVLTSLKQIGVPVYVIGFGASASATSSTGVCIAQNTGAVLPDGTPGYFSVSSTDQLYTVLNEVASYITEATKVFATATVSTAQVLGDQVTFLATFNAAKDRSIWNGRVNAYKLDALGNLKMGQRTISDAGDPNNGITLPTPSNDPSSLLWNAGQNLVQTPGTGATDPRAVLAPGAALSTGSYVDASNDTVSTIGTRFYPGRKIVFALPQGYATPVTTLPVAATDPVPETRYDLTYSKTAAWWPAVKALLGPQAAAPAVLSPALADDDAGDALRFIWGDRDAVMAATRATQKYLGLKLGDIFHSAPMLVGAPADFAYYSSNLNGYRAFAGTYGHRRRVLFAGANDGLMHAFDAGVWDRDRALCRAAADGSAGHCYDRGTGAELFAFAPRAVMQLYKPLKDAVGPQTKRDEWTVDGPPTAADVFLDASHPGTPSASRRSWRTVLVGGMREGSSFEGGAGASPQQSQGSYYALDITQPDPLSADGTGLVVPAPVSDLFAAPLCLNAAGDASCGRDAPNSVLRGNQPARDWPTVLWEITDTADQDALGSPGFGYADMGESWARPAVGRVKVCTFNCGRLTAPLPVVEDHYVAIFGGGFDRERKNRRGNWLYMVDMETGKTLYRANSSCGINSGSGCTPVYFGSMTAEPAALDLDGDGYLDVLYIGDLAGRLWRIALNDLRRLAAPPAGRFANQIDFTSGTSRPFLLFQAPQPVAPATRPFYPIYQRPTFISLGSEASTSGAIGIAFGTGDRDDILAAADPTSLTSSQRFYYVVDQANASTRTESDLTAIASPTAPSLSAAPVKGWYLQLGRGERPISDSIAARGTVFFSTFTPPPSVAQTDPCTNSLRCSNANGVPRLYRVLYATGNPASGGDRGETQSNATFLSEPVFFLSSEGLGQILFSTENTVKTENAPTGRQISIKSWKEGSGRR